MNIHTIPTIRLDSIRPNPNQPRKRFADIEGLAANIAEHGLIQPIMVRPRGDGYEIVQGERRWRAAGVAGLTELPAIVRELTDEEAFALALIENVQRQDLNPLDEAAAFLALQEQGKTQKEIGALISRGQSYVAHKMRLLRRPDPLRYYLAADVLTENHIRQVLKLRDLYPPGLQVEDRVGGSEKTWSSLLSKLDGVARDNLAWLMLTAARPEEEPVSFLQAPPAVVMEACFILSEYVAQHTEGMIPQWELAAFWWLSLAVTHDLSVARLAHYIDRWCERYESGVCWWYVINKTAKPTEPYGWAVEADLRHSASLDLDLANDAHQSAYVERIWEKWRVRGTLIAPSEMQRRAA